MKYFFRNIKLVFCIIDYSSKLLYNKSSKANYPKLQIYDADRKPNKKNFTLYDAGFSLNIIVSSFVNLVSANSYLLYTMEQRL